MRKARKDYVSMVDGEGYPFQVKLDGVESIVEINRYCGKVVGMLFKRENEAAWREGPKEGSKLWKRVMALEPRGF